MLNAAIARAILLWQWLCFYSPVLDELRAKEWKVICMRFCKTVNNAKRSSKTIKASVQITSRLFSARSRDERCLLPRSSTRCPLHQLDGSARFLVSGSRGELVSDLEENNHSFLQRLLLAYGRLLFSRLKCVLTATVHNVVTRNTWDILAPLSLFEKLYLHCATYLQAFAFLDFQLTDKRKGLVFI